MIQRVCGWRCFLLGVLFVGGMTADAQTPIPEPPILDPGATLRDPANRSVDEPEEIPVAIPLEDEEIPVAEPLPDSPPAQQASQIPVIPKVSSIPVEQEKTQVAILGYHDFSEFRPITEMCLRTSVFRRQMQALKDAGMPVISLHEFVEWKNGSRKLPEFCVMITIDDGWKSVYTDAYPILKEMGFPFTVFPYTRYLTGRGLSMSVDQVKEMLAAGATLGSHSTSHLFPSAWKRAQNQGKTSYDTLLDQELRQSRAWLQKRFGASVSFYCYPGGYHTPEMIEKLPTYGYVGALTVIPKKVRYDTDNWLLPRYMVFGNNPQIFANAVTFQPISESQAVESKTSGSLGSLPQAWPAPVQKVKPLANSVISDLSPIVSIDLSAEQDIDVKTLSMSIDGLGWVPAIYDPNSRVLSWEINRHMRVNTVTVRVRWKTQTGMPRLVEWQFGVMEPKTDYLPAHIVK